MAIYGDHKDYKFEDYKCEDGTYKDDEIVEVDVADLVPKAGLNYEICKQEQEIVCGDNFWRRIENHWLTLSN